VRAFRLIAAAVGIGAVLALVAGVASGAAPRAATKQAPCGHVEFVSQLEVVFGRFKKLASANKLLHRVVGAGFTNAEVIPECGDFKISVRGEESWDIAVDLQAEARGVGFRPTIECVKGKDDVGELEAVFGHRRDRSSANDLVTHLGLLGYQHLELESDPCGGFEIELKGFTSRQQADDFVAKARAIGVDVVIERS
jgi:hypothetical protein